MQEPLIESWPPDYDKEIKRRLALWKQLRDPEALARADRFYKYHPVEWINDFCVTFDPRVPAPQIGLMPFVLFKRQREFIEFLFFCWKTKTHGLIEKARDIGATWLASAFSVWLWKYWDGSVIGWGSLLAHNIDDRGNPKSIFLKIRQIIANLPYFMRPGNFIEKLHAPSMKVLHPYGTSAIIGEGGDNMGRGGRTTIYFKDEAGDVDSNVLTPSGYKKLGEIRIGDKICGLDGKAQYVKHINEVGLHETYTVSFSDGSQIKATPHHLWTVDKVWGKNVRKTITTEEMANKYYYDSPSGQRQFLYRVPQQSIILFDNDEYDLPLHPYLVGALLGDGSIGDVPNHSPKITSIDDEIIQQFIDLLPEGCNIAQEKGRITWRLGDDRGRMGWKYKSRARQAVVDAGIAGLRSADKHIPKRYLLSSPENRIALLQGLMDTDGSASSQMVTFHTGSPQLAKDVQFLMESLGGVASHRITKDNREERYLDMHILNIRLPSNIVPFRLTRKLKQMRKRSNAVVRTITSVTKDAQPCQTRCITVSNKDGLYLTDNCIVTHNSAHYEHAELIEAALGDNTQVQIDMSSVNGSNNIFYRRRMAGEIWYPGCVPTPGKVQVFIFDWSDHPGKTLEWYNERRAKAEAEGLLHVFAQEVDRDYAGSVDRIIIRSDWVRAAIDAHKVLGFTGDGEKVAGADISDGGGDKNALAIRHGIILKFLETRGGEAGEFAKTVLPYCIEYGVNKLFFDSIGVGAGFKTGMNNIRDNGGLPQSLRIFPWNAGASPIDPTRRIIPGDNQSPTNENQYLNLKAQAWFRLRSRFYKTFRAVRYGEKYPEDDMISIDSSIPKLNELIMELSQATHDSNNKGKTLVDKKPNGASSPNMADAMVMAYCPTKTVGILDVI